MMTALIVRARARNPEFTLMKVADDVGAQFDQRVAAMSPQDRAAMWSATMQAQGPDGQVNTKPIEEWAGVSPGGAWNPTNWFNEKARLAATMRDLHQRDPNALRTRAETYMRNGGMDEIAAGWQQPGQPAAAPDSGWGAAFRQGNGMHTYLPLGAGLLGLIGGAATKNKWIALLGALAAAYGGYQMWNQYKTVKDPAMWQKATAKIQAPKAPGTLGIATDPSRQAAYMREMGTHQTALADQAAARQQLNSARATLSPFMGRPAAPAPTAPTPLKKTAAVKLAWGISEVPDRADLGNSIKSHIDLYRMKQDITNDRLLDPVAAGKMLAGIDYAERKIGAAQASVGTFGIAAAPLLGLAAGIALGSLYATSNQTQGALRNAGDGVVSGALRLGVV